MDYRIDRVDGRARLRARRAPHWARLTQGRSLGYRKLTKTSPGTWLARIRIGEDYEQKPLGDFATLPEKERFDAAKRAAEEWFLHLDLGGATKAGTVEDACRDRVEYLRLEKSELAAKGAEGYYRRLIWGDKDAGIARDPLARIDLAKATRQDFEAFRKRLRKANKSETTFNRALTPIRAAMNHAHRVGKVATDQAWREALKPIKTAGKRRELYLDAAQRAKLVEHASEEGQRYLQVLRLLPLRPGDVANLRVADFKPQQRTLAVPDGKTGRRDIPLSAEAVAHFKECAKGKLPNAWLIARNGGGQWKKEAWRDEVKLAAAGARLPSGTVAYTIRHSVITDLVTGGTDIFTIAKLSGTSVAMIDQHYGHLQREHARAALDKLAALT